MCLSPSFQERSESLNTFKELLRCWLQHLIFCHSDHSSTCSTEPGSQASVNIPDSLNIFHIPSLTDYLIYVHTVRTRPSVRHLENLKTVISLHLFPRDLFWSSRLGGGQYIASVKAEWFYSNLNVYPEVFKLQAVKATQQIWTERPKGQRASASGSPQPTIIAVFPSALGSCPVSANLTSLTWRSCDPAGFSNFTCPHCLWVWTLKHEFEEQSSWELW